jgi:delta-aminolevulinic acid dehydratase/porphobilinogen synthase
LAAGLTKGEYKMMRTAFMNGYVRALRLDIETIKSLKKNKDELKKFIVFEANRYMEEVLNLNI